MTAPAPTRSAPAPRPVAGAPSPATAGAGGPTPPRPSRRNLFIAAGAGVAVLALVVVAVVRWGPWSDATPRLNDEPAQIAKFAADSDFTKLPFEKQRLYMDLLNKKEEALEQAYEQRLLSDDEYRKALQVAWYDKELGRMEKYFKKTSDDERKAYLDDVIDKKKGKDKGKVKSGSKPGPAGAKPPKIDKPKPDDLSPLTAQEVDRDDSAEESHIASWPDEVQQRWRQYRQALKDRKAQLKEQKKQKEAAAAKGGAAADDEDGDQ